MNYTEWETQISGQVSEQVLWKIQLYRLASFMTELAQIDRAKFVDSQSMEKIGIHLHESVNELKSQIMAAHRVEYLSRSMIASYQQALLAARQSKDWYYKSRHLLGEAICSHRIQLLQQLILLLLARLPVSESVRHIRPNTAFSVIPNHLLTDIPLA